MHRFVIIGERVDEACDTSRCVCVCVCVCVWVCVRARVCVRVRVRACVRDASSSPPASLQAWSSSQPKTLDSCKPPPSHPNPPPLTLTLRWHGDTTKRALFGGVPSPEELLLLISGDSTLSDVPVGLADRGRSLRQESAWAFLRARQRELGLGNKAQAPASKVTYQQFLDWIQRSVPTRKFLLPPDTSIDEVVKQFIVKVWGSARTRARVRVRLSLRTHPHKPALNLPHQDMNWAPHIFEPADEAKLLQTVAGPHAIYRYVAQMGEHIKLFAACGVTFTELSPSPPPPEADSGLETIVQAWRETLVKETLAKAAAAVQDGDAADASTAVAAEASGSPQAQAGPAKHEVAGGTWIVEAIARLVLRYSEAVCCTA